MSLRYIENVVTLDYDRERCQGCGLCVQVCPHGVLEMARGRARVRDRGACMECGACVRNCPGAALRVDAGEGCLRGVIKEMLGLEGPCC